MNTRRDAPARLLLALLAVGLILLAQGAPARSAASMDQGPGGKGQTIPVNCDRGQTIGRALTASRPDARIRVRGTCRERVVVTTDGITLDGQGATVLDAERTGVALTVDGARGVSILGFTVRNGTRGIDALNLATVSIEDSLVQASRSHGVEVTNASVSARNLTSRDNGRAGLIVNRNALLNVTNSTFDGNLTGLVVYSNANARLSGTNSMRGNATQGFTVGLGAAVFSLGSTVLVGDNGEEGVLLLEGGTIELIGGRLEVTGNALDGVKARQLAGLTIGITEFGTPGVALIEGNQGHGVSLETGSLLAVSEIMPLTSRANGASGLAVDGGSSAQVNGSTFEDNGDADVLLSFGALATLDDNVIGALSCDETVLVRGTVACP